MRLVISLFTDNLIAKAISVVIAVVLWVAVLGSRKVEIVKEIPIQVVTSEDVVVSSELPDRISFRLSGPKAFLRAVLNRTEEPIRVNLRGNKPGLVTYRFFNDNIRVPIGVKVLSINPPSLLIELEQVKTKEVPVRVDLKGSPPDGYQFVSASVIPNMVEIRGASSKLKQVNEVATSPVDLSEVRSPTEVTVPLDVQRYGVFVNSPNPKVSIDVKPLSANFKIRNVKIRVLSSHRGEVNEKTVTVYVRASREALAELDHKKVYAMVDLKDKAPGIYPDCKVAVALPKGIGVVKVVPQTVTVVLK